ncbi:SDR family NAD(P)-dependent oxidoreductase [Glycomyces xiaoerkulensis]|uniref:SDR family NAD(P)-dependent oxidoreductase n=1 Tax=Glycomyces xiaoerkulensis TaxID=2038139 RepID=UPI000C2647EF|nr:SDR family NAD(P)-dependent oxidoreductase [Glycomyces xiaoerkulensis]
MSKTIVITGASDGIGAAAAAHLHRAGHRVVIVGRNPSKTEKVAAALDADHYIADFAEFDQVRELADRLDRDLERIDVLANNAGGIFGDAAKTTDGFETTFQVNHLSPFLLTNLLMDKLITSHASVIQTSSLGARWFGHIEMDDLEHERDFTPQRAYGTGKLANILFTTELHRRYHARGLAAAAFHPGGVATNFATESDSFMQRFYTSRFARALMTSADKAAGQLVWLAEGTPGEDWRSGVYYERRKPARKVNPQARDAELAQRFWDKSAELVDIKTA